MRRYSGGKLPMLLAFLAATGCAAQAPPPARAQAQTSVSTASKSENGPVEAARTPAETLALADSMYESQLGASRGQFDEDRQIAMLQQEVLLYTQFLERAGGEPELEPAVRKSRERIADANATIEFLRQQQREAGRGPLRGGRD